MKQQNNTSRYIPGLYGFYLAVLFAILFLPLMSKQPWFHPPAWGKVLLFHLLFSLLIVVVIWHILYRPTAFKQKWDYLKQSLPFWLLAGLFALFVLATIFSVNPHFSFWGSPMRAGGSLNFLLYILFSLFLFLILRPRDWQRLWTFAMVVGIGASAFAFAQQLRLFSDYLVPYSYRPSSTFGNPIFFALYLLLLTFITLSFILKETYRPKKIFYSIALGIFLLAIMLTVTRAVYLGMAAGFFWFLFFYPARSRVIKKRNTIIGIALIVLVVLLVGYATLVPRSAVTVFKTELASPLNNLISRLSLNNAVGSDRISGWKISWEGIKERPLLGYGPENFSIIFDQHYDPNLPGIATSFGRGWWDRAHNVFFELGVTTGIPSAVVYVLLFGVLFWHLGRLKKNVSSNQGIRIIAHGIQATLLAYLVANFFSFDVFSTYLMFFFLVGYTLFLLATYQKQKVTGEESTPAPPPSPKRLIPFSVTIILFFPLLWFWWQGAIKPLWINQDVNWAEYFVSHPASGGCDRALQRMDRTLSAPSILDNHVRLKYTDVIGMCFHEKRGAEERVALSQKAVPVLKEALETRPLYTRSWLSLGAHTNILLEQAVKDDDEEYKQTLFEQANTALEKTQELSPNHQEIFAEWTKTYLYMEDYEQARIKAHACIDLKPATGECWWMLGVSYLYLNDHATAQEYMQKAEEKGMNVYSEKALSQALKAYVKLKDTHIIDDREYYTILKDIYMGLIKHNPQKMQYHASLAFVYVELGEYEKARDELAIVLKLSPESAGEIHIFINTFPPEFRSPI